MTGESDCYANHGGGSNYEIESGESVCYANHVGGSNYETQRHSPATLLQSAICGL